MEIDRNEGQVVIDIVPRGQEVDAVQITHSLVQLHISYAAG